MRRDLVSQIRIQLSSAAIAGLGLLLISALVSSVTRSTPARADEAGAQGELIRSEPYSNEWQALNLQEKLRDKLIAEFAPLIAKESYILTVAVNLLPQDTKPAPRPSVEPRDEGPSLLVKLKPEEAFVEADTSQKHNVFAQISGIAVNVWLDNQVPAEKEKVIKDLAANLAPGIAANKVSVKIERLELIKINPPPPPLIVIPTTWKDRILSLIGFLGEHDMALSLILVCLLACGALIMLVRHVSQVYDRHVDVLSAANMQREREFEAAQAAQRAREEAEHFIEVEGAQKPFEQFKELIRSSPYRAAQFIQQWTAMNHPGARNTLAILPKLVTIEDFRKLVSLLSPSEVTAWRKVIGAPINEETVVSAKTFLSSYLLKSMMTRFLPIDDSLKDLMGTVTAPELIQCAESDNQIGAILLNLVTPGVTGKALSLMDPESARKITWLSMQIQTETILASADSVRNAIVTLRQRNGMQSVPFLESASELIPQLGPERETLIFDALAMGSSESLVEAARNHFPSELIVHLSVEVVHQALVRLPVRTRAEIVWLSKQEELPKLLEAIGEDGSKLREINDVELEQINSQEAMQAELQKRAREVRSQFVDAVRSVIRSSPAFSHQAQQIIKQWVDSRSRSHEGTENGSPKVA